jgi:hypothetical protein
VALQCSKHSAVTHFVLGVEHGRSVGPLLCLELLKQPHVARNQKGAAHGTQSREQVDY